MSHLHIADGVFPIFWPVAGYAVTVVIIALSLYNLRHRDRKILIPKLGIMAALMLVVMSVPLGLPVHLNLTVLTGIVLGPSLGFVAVFLVNLLLSLLGHGGVSVVGLNTLAVGSEVFFGYYLFTLLKRVCRITPAAALATFLTLALSSLLMLGIVGVSQVNPASFMETEEHGALDVHKGAVGDAEQVQDGDDHDALADVVGKISMPRFAALALPLSFLGASLETLAVALVVGFLAKVRPDILGL